MKVFEKYKGYWEVEPIKNSNEAYSFWKKTIEEYTNGNYIIKNNGTEKIFIFNNN